jgi:hypothetical protein
MKQFKSALDLRLDTKMFMNEKYEAKAELYDECGLGTWHR